MKQQVLFIILDQYADWEYSFLASALQDRIKDKHSSYEVKTLSVDQLPVKSIGGFTTMPDYDINHYPTDFQAVFLIGGTSWRTEKAKKLLPLVQKAYKEKRVLGAICDATVFLGMNAVLNERKHTSNTLEDLVAASQSNYWGQERYQHQQAVRDGHLITANGTGYLEFMRECLLALEAYPPDYIEDNYQFFKLGYIEILKQMQESEQLQ